MQTSGEPVEDEVKAVYAAYGLAMFKSQVLERGMAHFLAISAAPRETLRAALDDRLAEHYDATFGTLADLTAGSLADGALREQLIELKGVRNRLAHSYFWERGLALTTGSGCRQMVSELFGWVATSSKANASIDALTRQEFEKRGITDQDMMEAMEEVLAGRIPSDPERVPRVVRVAKLVAWRPCDSKGPAFSPILETESGTRFVLGDRGLCWAPTQVPADEIEDYEYPAAAFPAEVKTRPASATAWSYSLPLSGGFELWVIPGGESGYAYRFGIRRARTR